MKAFLVVAAFVASVCVRASDSDPTAHFPGVADLSPDTFDSEVIKSGKTWLIEFYAPWCGWCKKIAPTMKELGAEYLNSESVKIGKFDCTQGNSEDIKKKYGISGFPTILLFSTSDPEHPSKYSGQRALHDFKEYITQNTPKDAPKATESNEGAETKEAEHHENKEAAHHEIEHKEAEVKEAEHKEAAPAFEAGKVVNLDPQTFSNVVNDPTKNVFVKFYAPWCGHCRHLEPVYDQLADSFKDRSDIVIARLDASAHPDAARPYNIAGFPTLKYFPKGDKSGAEYHGDRSLNSLKGFVEGKSQ